MKDNHEKRNEGGGGGNLAGQAFLLFFSCSFLIQRTRQYRLGKATCYNLVPRSIFRGFGGGRPTSKAREKRPGEEVLLAMQTMSRLLQIRWGGGGTPPIFGY